MRTVLSIALLALAAGASGVPSPHVKRHVRHAVHPNDVVEAAESGAGSGAGPAPGADGSGNQSSHAPTLLPWGLNCPDGCTCHEGPFREVPLRRLLISHEDYVSFDGKAIREDLDAGRSVRQAVCVVLSDSHEDVFAGLPPDTQALTLLQGADEAAIAIMSSHLERLGDLVSLDVTAFAEAGVHLRSDALRTLTHLRLLSLNGVRLEGALEDDNEIEVTTQPPVHHRRRRLPPWAYHTPGQSEETPQLVFLKPAEVVPFSKFSELRRINTFKTFEGLEKLFMLRLHHADIVDIAWEMFNGLEDLQVLSLKHNGLAYVPDWALYGAPSLRYLSLAHNALLDVAATALVGLLELRFLDLSHNNLSHLSELSLPPFPKLREADFRGNPIEDVFTNTFLVMNSTETLQLGGSGTALQLHADMFQGLRALRRLSATDVTASTLQRELLRGIPRLKDLTLRGSIPSLPYDAFFEVPKLERLVLRQCSIRHVSMDAFYALYALEELDLSYNQLQTLPYSLLDQQTHLKELLLSGNRLKELPLGMLESVPAKMVRLDGNPWDCSCDMASWNPAATNKDKREGRYVYDKHAAPTCATPERYAGWDVYDALRKGFRCNKNPSKRLRPKLNALPGLTPAANTSARTENDTARPRTSNYVIQPEVSADNASNVTAAVGVIGVTAAPGASSGTSRPIDGNPSTASPEMNGSSTEGPTAGSTAASTAASTAWTDSSTSSGHAGLRAGHAGHRGGHRGGQRRGKNRQHHHLPVVSHELLQGEEGTLTKDGKYLLSDGNGGYISVSRKAFKAAMEERRDAKTRQSTIAPPAAG